MGHRTRIFCITLVLLTGCAAPSGRVPLSLPTPHVYITQNNPGTSIPPTSTLNETPTPDSTSIPSGSLQDLAMQAYGSRLIQRIQLPSIAVDSPVVTVGWLQQGTPGSVTSTAEWDSPGPAVGWVLDSALPDQPGNILLYGHNNMYGSIFKYLWKVQPGDSILIQTGNKTWPYRVDRVLILPMQNASELQRQDYLSYLAETQSPRLTLISCWPPESNTHRVVVIAYPGQSP